MNVQVVLDWAGPLQLRRAGLDGMRLATPSSGAVMQLRAIAGLPVT